MRTISFFFLLAFGIQVYSQCACCAGAGTCVPFGGIGNNLLTLNKNQWLAEANADFRKISAAELAHSGISEETPLQSMLIHTLGVRYGISNKLTLSATLPYVFLQTHSGNDKGLGDLSFVGTYLVHSKKQINVAIQAGLELPTGTQKSSNFDNTTVVLGSGSFDPIAAILFSKQWDKLILQGNGMYKLSTNGFENNYYGSVSSQSLNFKYALKKQKDSSSLKNKDKLTCSITCGYYGEYLDHFKEDGVVDDNSGYYLGFATLGSILSIQQWKIPFTFSVPTYQNMNGDQSNASYRIRIGVMKLF